MEKRIYKHGIYKCPIVADCVILEDEQYLTKHNLTVNDLSDQCKECVELNGWIKPNHFYGKDRMDLNPHSR
jgi:hypothetical protein